MRSPRPLAPALLAVALVWLACVAGCLGRKSDEDVQYYRAVGRGPTGLRQGEGPITRRQARTQEHWRVHTQDGRTTQLVRHDGSGALIEEVRVVYGAGGRVAEENTHGADGRLEESLAFTYDDRGRMIATSRRTAAAGLREQRQWTYDERDRLKELRVYGPRGVPLWHDEFVYDPHDPAKLLGVRRFDKDNAPLQEIPASAYSFWE